MGRINWSSLLQTPQTSCVAAAATSFQGITEPKETTALLKPHPWYQRTQTSPVHATLLKGFHMRSQQYQWCIPWEKDADCLKELWRRQAHFLLKSIILVERILYLLIHFNWRHDNDTLILTCRRMLNTYEKQIYSSFHFSLCSHFPHIVNCQLYLDTSCKTCNKLHHTTKLL